MREHPKLSVVIAALDEADSVGPLIAELREVLRGLAAEILVVDDGSTDGTADRCEALGVRVERHPRNLGQSAATLTGIRAARGTTIVTLAGDGQDDPRSIRDLLAALDGCDAATGVRVPRQDPWSRRVASRIAFRVRHFVLRDGIEDVGCSMRAFSRAVGLQLPAFDGLHRVLPAVLVFMGLRVAQVPTAHRPRTAGVSKYDNLRRGARGLFDLIGLLWLKYRVLPASSSAEGEAAVDPAVPRALEDPRHPVAARDRRAG